MWRRTCLFAFVVSAGLVTVSQSLLAQSNFTELLTKIPSSTNTLVILNAEQIFASDVAKRDGWKQQYESTYADAPLLLPPGAQQFVLAADLDLSHLEPRWQVAVMRLADDPSMNLIARSLRGDRDEVGGLEALTTPKGAMIVKFSAHLFGLMQPGNRQVVARWVRDVASSSEPKLSPYLKAAADVPDRVGTEIVMAIDLTDALRPESVKQALGKSPVLRDKSIDHAGAAEVITSIRGLTLGARVMKRVYGKLKIDFDRDPKILAEVAKPLLIEVLGEAGASIEEFDDWKVEVGERRISLEGELTQSGLRRLFSFLEIDATAVDAGKDADTSKPEAREPSVDAYASQQYFQAIQRHLRDLKLERGASSYYTIAVWFDKYAGRIDRLPILHVDKDLVDYGQSIVSQLRNCVEAIRGSGIQSGARSAQVHAGDSGYGSYPVFSSGANYAAAEVGAVEQERRAIRAQERGQSSTDVRAFTLQIKEETSKIRRLMTERYNVEFSDFPRRSSK